MNWLISLLITWFIAAVSLWMAAKIVPGISISSFKGSFWVAIIFGIVNALVGWLLWTVFAIGSLGLALLLAFITRLIINAILLKITAALSDEFEVKGVIPAILGALVVAVTSTVVQWAIGLFIHIKK